MVKKEITLRSFPDAEFGPTTRFVQLAGVFSSRITVTLDGKTVNAKSLMGMLMLSMTENDLLTVCCDGEDEQKAAEEIARVFGKN